MSNFYAPIGPQMKILGGPILKPLLTNLFKGLTGLLFLLLVPLLNMVIFRARKKHAMAMGEWDNTSIGLLIIYQESLRERE